MRTDRPATPGAVAAGPAPTGETWFGPAPTGAGSLGPPPMGPEPLGPGPALLPVPATPRPPARRRSVTAALALAVLTVAVVVAYGDADERFVEGTRAQGHAVPGGVQQALLVSGARKICERKESHSTPAERRATALTVAELGVVVRTYPNDVRSFTVLALRTYCGL